MIDQSTIERAQAITDRLLPDLAAAHGFYEREAFADRAVRGYWRKRLQLYLAARLRAKGTGTAPEIRLPRHADHLFGPGTAMHDVAAFIEAQKASTR